MNIDEGHTPIEPAIYEEAKGLRVAAASGEGRLLVFGIEEMKAMARGRGVILMGLEDKEKLCVVAAYNGKTLLIEGVSKNGKAKSVTLSGAKLEHHVGHRARMGRVLPDRMTPVSISVPDQP